MYESKTNVYVFGAGASFHVGGPLTKDFIREGICLLCNPDIYDVSEESYFKVVRFIDKLYNKDLVKEIEYARKSNTINITESYSFLNDVSIEELLSFVDISIYNNENWLQFKELQSSLYDFIFETLDWLTKGYGGDVFKPTTDGTLDHNRNCYDKLVDYLINIDDDNCFISFNYDLFLDTAVSINNHRLLGDYNIDFITTNNFPGYERILEGKRLCKDVDILKLHGSLNWSYCSKCEGIHMAFANDYNSITKEKCSICGMHLTPVLIPPTLKKNVSAYGIDKIWRKAEEKLLKANNIFIIGYSFPDADVKLNGYLKNLLQRAEKGLI